MPELFKYVNIANWESIRDAILLSIPEELLTATSSSLTYPPQVTNACRKNDNLMAEFRRLGLFDFWYATGVVVVKPNSALPIHTDTGHHIWSLNMPVLNCPGTSTVFYEGNAEPEYIPLNNGKIGYNKFLPENCTEIERFTLDRPAILRVDVPHNVVNPNDTLRIALAFRIADEFNFDLGNF